MAVALAGAIPVRARADSIRPGLVFELTTSALEDHREQVCTWVGIKARNLRKVSNRKLREIVSDYDLCQQEPEIAVQAVEVLAKRGDTDAMVDLAERDLCSSAFTRTQNELGDKLLRRAARLGNRRARAKLEALHYGVCYAD